MSEKHTSTQEEIEALRAIQKPNLKEKMRLKTLLKKVSSGNSDSDQAEPKSMFMAGNAENGPVAEEIDIDMILDNPYQPRKHFRPHEIEAMADSIEENRLLQPISLTRLNGDVILIAGQKRLKAYRLLNQREAENGLEPFEMKYRKIRSNVFEVKNNSEISGMSLAENLARENPFFLDTAIAIKTHFDLLRKEDPKLKQKDYEEYARKKFGIQSKGTISKYFKIASLDEDVRAEIFKQEFNSFANLYEIAKSKIDNVEKIKMVRGEIPISTSSVNPTAVSGVNIENSEGTDSGNSKGEQKNKLNRGEQGGRNAGKKSKNTIDISYLVSSINDMAAAASEDDKEKIRKELNDYLTEYGE